MSGASASLHQLSTFFTFDNEAAENIVLLVMAHSSASKGAKNIVESFVVQSPVSEGDMGVDNAVEISFVSAAEISVFLRP